MNTREQIDGGCILLSRQIFEKLNKASPASKYPSLKLALPKI